LASPRRGFPGRTADRAADHPSWALRFRPLLSARATGA